MLGGVPGTLTSGNRYCTVEPRDFLCIASVFGGFKCISELRILRASGAIKLGPFSKLPSSCGAVGGRLTLLRFRFDWTISLIIAARGCALLADELRIAERPSGTPKSFGKFAVDSVPRSFCNLNSPDCPLPSNIPHYSSVPGKRDFLRRDSSARLFQYRTR